MIRFERTRDYELVARIMTHPRLYSWIADDFYPPPENFWPNASESIFYLLVFDVDESSETKTGDGDLLGLIITHPINALLWETHLALLPHAWGETAREIAAAFEAWLWATTPAKKAVGFMPADNTLGIRYLRRVGWREAGRLEACYMRFGRLLDLLIFEKSRG